MSNQLLIVDDQVGIRLLLEEIFKGEGYKTLSAKTGKHACDMIAEHDVDLMIMDYNLPVMHGKEVLKELHQKNSQLPVIIVTGQSSEEIEKDTNYSFVRHIISKPFDIHNLKELVAGSLTHTL
ncbi:response regulator [Halobacillus fulvus]|nr:response regulator [Halobacillus fulvus]